MDDPIKIAVIGGVTISTANQLAKQLQDFIASITGHKGESIGTILGDISRRRAENTKKVVEKAHFTLLNIGVKTGDIPLNVLNPIFEGASLQEDPTLQDTWANLLANAADARRLVEVRAAFPRILSNLTPREVKFLDLIYPATGGFAMSMKFGERSLMDLYIGAALNGGVDIRSVSVQDSYDPKVLVALEQWRIMLETIAKEGLLQAVTSTQPSEIDLNRFVAGQPSSRTTRVDVKLSYDYTRTSLGRAFVAACRAPQKVQPQEPR